MDKIKIARINELAKKKREVGLNEIELLEQKALREEYLKVMREEFKVALDSIKIQEADGTITDLNRKTH